MFGRSTRLLATLAFVVATPAAAAPSGAVPPLWAPAWTASPQRVWDRDFIFPSNLPTKLQGRSLRQVARLAIGGQGVRVRLSNEYGRQPLGVAAAHLAVSAGGASIAPGSDTVLTFGGARSVTLPPGTAVVSDPVTRGVTPGQDLAISLSFTQEPVIEGFHWDGRRTAYVFEGGALSDPSTKPVETSTVRLFLSAVLVRRPALKGTVVVLGDSITDGATASLDAEHRWTDYLAERAGPRDIAVINAGISGARLLSDGMGDNALARLERDVLVQPQIKTMILMLGTNDIAWPGSPFAPDEPPMTFERLTAGYRQLVQQAHAANIRVIGATLPPFADALPGTPLHATYSSAQKDALRGRVNQWIRTAGVFDGIVDFDRVLRDPKAPQRLRPDLDSGDHLHPGDAGNAAMAADIDLDTLAP